MENVLNESFPKPDFSVAPSHELTTIGNKGVEKTTLFPGLRTSREKSGKEYAALLLCILPKGLRQRCAGNFVTVRKF
ncbi:hypothetical protein [Brasilonema sp. UFV-L1]|uniref:hypothetical protein n=1 Tax=Brasilonema sp. UFV-L1 TaxID=2234130 RepID=UPI00145E1A09|nr:hypothetical protein [Brasilonema sp. UFV-L1]NMG10203.1 hypothetical protein [Brasilonema sp. UFV-L1]